VALARFVERRIVRGEPRTEDTTTSQASSEEGA
jgi:hypothetical protein